MGLMGHKDLMVALGHDINNVVVVVANIRAAEVWQINYFMLSDDNLVQNNLFATIIACWTFVLMV